MPSDSEKSHKFSGTPKRVHFEDAEKPPSSSRSPSARLPRRPGSPYPDPARPISDESHYHDTPAKEQQASTDNRPQDSLHSFPKFSTAGQASSFGQPIFTHYIGGLRPQPLAQHPPNCSFYPGSQPASTQQYQGYIVNPASMPAPYENAVPVSTGVHFQPQVPDTTNGPQLHYYIPRHDGTTPGVPMQPLQPLQPIQPVQQIPVQVQAQPVAIPLQQVVTPFQPVIQQAAVQPVMQPVMVQPGMQPAPAVPQPVFIQSQPHMMLGNPTPVPSMSFQGGVHPEPALGVGLTATEAHMMNEQIAYESNIDEPQDFKPADPDPSRMYRVRELDGAWTLRNRFTIENMGDFRWYITDDGVFYAVRLQN